MQQLVIKAILTLYALIATSWVLAATPLDAASIEDAAHHVEMARNEDAEIYAPLELHFAEKRLEQAQLALQVKDKGALQRITEEVIVASELASIKSRLAKLRQQVEQRSHENSRLREEVSLQAEPKEIPHDDF